MAERLDRTSKKLVLCQAQYDAALEARDRALAELRRAEKELRQAEKRLRDAEAKARPLK